MENQDENKKINEQIESTGVAVVGEQGAMSLDDLLTQYSSDEMVIRINMLLNLGVSKDKVEDVYDSITANNKISGNTVIDTQEALKNLKEVFTIVAIDFSNALNGIVIDLTSGKIDAKESYKQAVQAGLEVETIPPEMRKKETLEKRFGDILEGVNVLKNEDKIKLDENIDRIVSYRNIRNNYSFFGQPDLSKLSEGAQNEIKDAQNRLGLNSEKDLVLFNFKILLASKEKNPIYSQMEIDKLIEQYPQYKSDFAEIYKKGVDLEKLSKDENDFSKVMLGNLMAKYKDREGDLTEEEKKQFLIGALGVLSINERTDFSKELSEILDKMYPGLDIRDTKKISEILGISNNISMKELLNEARERFAIANIREATDIQKHKDLIKIKYEDLINNGKKDEIEKLKETYPQYEGIFKEVENEEDDERYNNLNMNKKFFVRSKLTNIMAEIDDKYQKNPKNVRAIVDEKRKSEFLVYALATLDGPTDELYLDKIQDTLDKLYPETINIYDYEHFFEKAGEVLRKTPEEIQELTINGAYKLVDEELKKLETNSKIKDSEVDNFFKSSSVLLGKSVHQAYFENSKIELSEDEEKSFKEMYSDNLINSWISSKNEVLEIMYLGLVNRREECIDEKALAEKGELENLPQSQDAKIRLLEKDIQNFKDKYPNFDDSKYFKDGMLLQDYKDNIKRFENAKFTGDLLKNYIEGETEVKNLEDYEKLPEREKQNYLRYTLAGLSDEGNPVTKKFALRRLECISNKDKSFISFDKNNNPIINKSLIEDEYSKVMSMKKIDYDNIINFTTNMKSSHTRKKMLFAARMSDKAFSKLEGKTVEEKVAEIQDKRLKNKLNEKLTLKLGPIQTKNYTRKVSRTTEKQGNAMESSSRTLETNGENSKDQSASPKDNSQNQENPEITKNNKELTNEDVFSKDKKISQLETEANNLDNNVKTGFFSTIIEKVKNAFNRITKKQKLLSEGNLNKVSILDISDENTSRNESNNDSWIQHVEVDHNKALSVGTEKEINVSNKVKERNEEDERV